MFMTGRADTLINSMSEQGCAGRRSPRHLRTPFVTTRLVGHGRGTTSPTEA